MVWHRRASHLQLRLSLKHPSWPTNGANANLCMQVDNLCCHLLLHGFSVLSVVGSSVWPPREIKLTELGFISGWRHSGSGLSLQNYVNGNGG